MGTVLAGKVDTDNAGRELAEGVNLQPTLGRRSYRDRQSDELAHS